MSNMEQATDIFIAAIKESEVYKTYRTELEKVKAYPELKAQIDDFRAKNYELQMASDNNYDKLDRFEKEYENFREQPLVADFLAAELALCRMIQHINTQITEGLDFE